MEQGGYIVVVDVVYVGLVHDNRIKNFGGCIPNRSRRIGGSGIIDSCSWNRSCRVVGC